MCLVRPSQRGRDDLTQSDRVHLDLRAWTLEIPPMRIPTLLPLLDRLPSDPYTHLGLPAALGIGPVHKPGAGRKNKKGNLRLPNEPRICHPRRRCPRLTIEVFAYGEMADWLFTTS